MLSVRRERDYRFLAPMLAPIAIPMMAKKIPPTPKVSSTSSEIGMVSRIKIIPGIAPIIIPTIIRFTIIEIIA